jgi:hypothetical protein
MEAWYEDSSSTVVALIDELETCFELKAKPAGRPARQLNMPASIAKVTPVPRLPKKKSAVI